MAKNAPLEDVTKIWAGPSLPFLDKIQKNSGIFSGERPIFTFPWTRYLNVATPLLYPWFLCSFCDLLVGAAAALVVIAVYVVCVCFFALKPIKPHNHVIAAL